jgi:AAA domain-containing protein
MDNMGLPVADATPCDSSPHDDAAAGGDAPCDRLSVAAWLSREIAPPDFLLGELLSTTSRLMLIGPTGLGKTMFALELAFALALGRSFLHWRAGRPCRVLYIDGEMPRRLIRARLTDATKRWDAVPGTLFILARDDVDNMPPLNTMVGQTFVERYIKALGGIDLIIFDNVQALLNGNMREGDAWEGVKSWLRKLTKQQIGQLWVHHTGHNEEHGYGDKTREWEMSTVMLMKRIVRPDADVAFQLDFPKTRERTPENRTDFAPVVVTLADDQWRGEAAGATSGYVRQRDKLLTLIDLVTQDRGMVPPADGAIPAGKKCALLQHVRDAWVKNEAAAKPGVQPESHVRSYKRALGELSGVIGQNDPWVWIVD